MKYKNIILPIAISALTITPLSAQDQNTDVVELEKAVFLQDTKKDYAAAAKIYLEVLEKSKRENLETTYRLSQCQKLLGQQNEYRNTLDQLSKYKDQKNKWVKLAIEEKKIALKFEKPVWEDGDALVYNAIFPNKSGKSHTVLYDKMSGQSEWKVTKLRSNYHFSREDVSFDASLNYRPLSSNAVFVDTGGGLHTKYDIKKAWDNKSFEDGQFLSLVRVLPMDTVKRSYVITTLGKKWPIILYRTDDKRKIVTAAGEFECSKVICKVDVERGVTIEMWLNTKGKRELIELSKPNRKVQLARIAKRKDLESEITKIDAISLMHHSKSGLHEAYVNNDQAYRAMLFPSKGVYLARLEINHTKNLLESLRKDPVAFATYIENNMRKQNKVAQFKLPKDAERLTLAGCEGVIYRDMTLVRDSDGSDQFICFYGVNEKYAISLRGSYRKGQEKVAVEEIKRILTEDLKAIE